ncbi:MAG: hypothetical protein WED10_14605 [Brumimicrobium sp.]
MKRVIIISVFKFVRLQQPLSLFLILFFIPFSLLSQDHQVFKGKYILSDELEGKAQYSYYLENEGHIKDGEFSFIRDVEDTTTEEGRESFELEGNYSDGLKNGKWKFSNKKLSPEGETSIEDYSISRKSSGEEFSVLSKFSKGKAEGKWVATKTKIKNGVKKDTFFFASSSFSNNQLTGDLVSKNRENQLVGTLNKKGFLDGEWIIFHNDSVTPTVEYRQFENGVLVKHEIEKNGVRHDVHYTGLDQSKDEGEDWIEMELNKNYFDVLYFTNTGAKNEGVISLSLKTTNAIIEKSHKLMGNTFHSFFEYNGIPIWGSDIDFEVPKVKLRKYDYTQDERTALKKSSEIITQTEETINAFLDDPQVEISRNSNEEVAIYFEAYETLKTEFLKLKNVFEILNRPALEYIDRTKLLPHIFIETNYPDSISYSYNDKDLKKKIDYPTGLNNEDATLNRLFSQLEEVNKLSNSFKEKVTPILEKDKKRAQLSEKENELVAKRDTIRKRFNKDGLNEYQRRFSDKTISYVNKKFKEYAKQSLSDRIETLDETLECFDQFIEFYDQLEELPNQIERVEEIYTRTVWNPFFMRDMDEIVKERLYNAYHDVLIDFLLDELSRSLNCDKVAIKAKNFNILYNRMKELREIDTKDIEKKLRRVSDPHEIIEILVLKLNVN